MTVYTIGHSTRSLDDFVGLLQAHGVAQLADVRTIPKSRRHPHFAGEALSESLPAAGIRYRHFAGLGGMRKPLPIRTTADGVTPAFAATRTTCRRRRSRARWTNLVAWSDERRRRR